MDNNQYGNQYNNQFNQPTPTMGPQPAASTPTQPYAPIINPQPISPTPAQPYTTQNDVPTIDASKTPAEKYSKVDGFLSIFAILAFLFGINSLRTFLNISFKSIPCDGQIQYQTFCTAINIFAFYKPIYALVTGLANIIFFFLIIKRKKLATKVATPIFIINIIMGAILFVLVFTIINEIYSISPLAGYFFERYRIEYAIILVVTLFYAIGGIIYFRKSERVKKTLVE